MKGYSEMTIETVWITVATRDRLRGELGELERTTQSSETSDTARARELRQILRNAQVDRKPDDGLVEPGMRVDVRFERDGSTTSFLLGSRQLSSLDPGVDLDVYSPTSPLGAAISGRYVGDVVSFTPPSGEQQVTILTAVPFG